MSTRVQFGNVAFRSSEAGTGVIRLADITGWWDAPRDLTTETRHGTGSGIVSGLPAVAARTVQITGYLSGSSGQVRAAKDQLNAQRTGVLTVEELDRGLAREATVRRVALSFERITAEFERFSITLLADDPLRYAAGFRQLGPNGGIFLPNRGNAVALPILELNGPQGPVTIAHPRGFWTLTPTPAGKHRVVDPHNSAVWELGVRVFRQETGPSPAVLPGGSVWVVDGLGAGGAIVRHFEAWT